MVLAILIIAILVLFGRNLTAAGGPLSALSGVFGNSATPRGKAVSKPILSGFQYNSGVVPSTPIFGRGSGVSINFPTGTGAGRQATGLNSAASSVPSKISGGGGNVNTNATPAPTTLPGYAGLQPSVSCCNALGYCNDPCSPFYGSVVKQDQPAVNQCTVTREPCTALGTSCCVTPYTPPCSNAGGSCYYACAPGGCLPGYCGPAPVCVAASCSIGFCGCGLI
jgi:hypothetical protein